MSERSRGVLPRQSHLFFFAILALLLFIDWIVFKPFLILMVTGVFIAVLSYPIDRFWEKRLPNRLAAMMTMLCLLLILTLPIVGLGLALASDASDLAEAIREGRHDEWIEDGLNNTLVQRALAAAYPDNTTAERNETILNMTSGFEEWTLEQLTKIGRQIATGAPDFFLALVVIMFVTYYVLTDGHQLIGFLKRASPVPARQMDYLLVEAHNGMKAVFAGQILTSLIQGALGGIGFLVAGVPGAIVWAAVMAVLSLLPVVGAFLVWVPAVLFLFFQWTSGEVALWRPIFLAAWGLIVVSQVDNFIRPRLIGDRANIHPIFVLIGVLGGVAAFGFIGLFLGPLVVGITLSVLRVWESDYLDPRVGAEDPTVRFAVGGKATLAQDETRLGDFRSETGAELDLGDGVPHPVDDTVHDDVEGEIEPEDDAKQ